MSSVQKFYATLVLIIAGLVAVAYFLPYYLFLKISDSAGRLAAARQELSSADQRLASVRREEAALASHQADLVKIHGYFFSPKNPLAIVETIESVGRMSGVAVENDVLDSDNTSIRFRLGVIGAYPQIAKFARLIEQAPLYFEIQNYELERVESLMEHNGVITGKAASGAPVLRASLTVKLYSSLQ